MRKKVLVLILVMIVFIPLSTKNQVKVTSVKNELKETVEELSRSAEELNKVIIDVNNSLKKF